jgi:hypothetical protein
MQPRKEKLDEEKSKHTGLAQQKFVEGGKRHSKV